MKKSVLIAGAAVTAMLALSGAAVLPVSGQDATAAPSADQLAAGKHTWSDAACANCHGPHGEGGHGPDFPKGPNLRTSGLDPNTMLQMIECGIPNSPMPAWLKGAYTQTSCYGHPVGPAPAGTTVNGLYGEDDLKNLVAYIQTTFMTPAQ